MRHGPVRAARAVLVLVSASAVVATGMTALAAARAPDPAAATRWLAATQTDAGTFGSTGQPADGVAETVVALIAGGADASVVSRALDAIAATGPERARERPAYAARIVLGLIAAGRDPASFGGEDYVALIEARPTATAGELDEGLYANAVAALGLAAARGRLPDAVVGYLRANECGDGGFGHERGCVGGADVDTTAMTMAALAAGGIARGDEVVARARAFLAGARNPDGGFGLGPGSPTNANSTGIAVSALLAAGEDVDAAPWTRGARGPMRALAALQGADGAFRYLAGQDRPNHYATVQATPAAARAAYPVTPRAAGAGDQAVDHDGAPGRVARSTDAVTRASGARADRAPAERDRAPREQVAFGPGPSDAEAPRSRTAMTMAGALLLGAVGAARAITARRGASRRWRA